MKQKQVFLKGKGCLFLFIIILFLHVSPLLYSSVIVYGAKESGPYDIWSMNGDGTALKNLSKIEHDPTSIYHDFHPKWSPDGSKIAFTSNKSGINNIWIMNADGTEPNILTGNNRLEMNSYWHPDGKKIYFSINENYGSGCGKCPYYEIVVFHLGNSTETKLTNNYYRDIDPAVSPDGNLVAYTKAENPNDCCNATDLWIMNADGSNQRLLYGFKDWKYEWISCWGKANDKILFAKQFDCSNSSSCYEVGYMAPDGSSVFRVTNNSDYDYPYVFSPDGTKILFKSDRSGKYNLWIMDLDGSGPIQITDFSSVKGADWKGISLIDAEINIDPDVLNLKSNGKSITAYIELPTGYDVLDIDIDTVKLEYDSSKVTASCGDIQGKILMVKFDRYQVKELLNGVKGTIELKLTGQVNDKSFVGIDAIKVK
jgi:Tol biopolymer transport system component